MEGRNIDKQWFSFQESGKGANTLFSKTHRTNIHYSMRQFCQIVHKNNCDPGGYVIPLTGRLLYLLLSGKTSRQVSCPKMDWFRFRMQRKKSNKTRPGKFGNNTITAVLVISSNSIHQICGYIYA